MTGKFFVDTNVLVYVRDSNAKDKQMQAEAWLRKLWKERSGIVSYQVLQELYVTLTRKMGVKHDLAQQEVSRLLAWGPVVIDKLVLQAAWKMEERFSISWWDALIAGAAQITGCDYLLTEDLQHDLDLDGVRVVNPFRTAP